MFTISSYPQLGLNLKLSREQCENTNLRQYVSLVMTLCLGDNFVLTCYGSQ